MTAARKPRGLVWPLAGLASEPGTRAPRAAASERWARIHATVKRIPRGRVASYGQVAAEAGLPGHARQVGYALHALGDGSPVPWHRVVNASGRISLPPGSASAVTQRMRLEREGVRFDGAGRVDLKTHGWRPRERAAASGRRSGTRVRR